MVSTLCGLAAHETASAVDVYSVKVVDAPSALLDNVMVATTKEEPTFVLGPTPVRDVGIYNATVRIKPKNELVPKTNLEVEVDKPLLPPCCGQSGRNRINVCG
jgi:hypothetical protein